MTPEKIAELEHDAQRWRNAHDKILEVVADREKEMCEDLREAVHRITELENEVARLRQQARLATDSIGEVRTKMLLLLEALEEIADGDGCDCCVGPGCDWKCKEIAHSAINAARSEKWTT